MSTQPSVLEDSSYIREYDQSIERRYLDDRRNGLLGAALGPDREPALKQVPQFQYTAPQSLPNEMFKPIKFHVRPQLAPRELPLKLADAIGSNIPGLCDAGDLVSLGDRTKATMRVELKPRVGRPIKLSSPMNIPGSDKDKLLPRAEVSYRVAKAVWNIIGTGVWELENGDKVRFKDLYLDELRHVTTGSFQPVLVYYPARV